MCSSDLEVVRIERETLLRFIQDNPDVRDRLDQVAYNRHDDAYHEVSSFGTDNYTQQSIENINSILNKNK